MPSLIASLGIFSSFLICAASAVAVAVAAAEDEVPHVLLHGGQKLPLMGTGVGNLQHELIVRQIEEAMHHKIRLIDTAHASHNHHLVLEGVRRGLQSTVDVKEMHVVTKIWYTYLGYERTKIAVKEALEQLGDNNVRVHLLLHWPRCRTDISWMNCEAEEEALPKHVKEAGPPPHLDKDNAFKESWRALEDIYLEEIALGEHLPKVESIGVSNFEVKDLESLSNGGARMSPHILQDNVWTFVFNPFLIDYCHTHQIHYQAYNVMNGILMRHAVAPIAHNSLQLLADDLSRDAGEKFTVSQVILKWLIQNEVSVIPRTTNPQHLKMNSPAVLATMRDLSVDELDKAKSAIVALLRGQDLKQPQANFVNQHTEVLHLFWRSDTGEEVAVKEDMQPGETFDTSTFPGHVFVAYDKSKSQSREFTIQAHYGEREQFHLEL